MQRSTFFELPLLSSIHEAFFGQRGSAQSKSEERTPLERLEAIKHDLATVPKLFCDCVSFEPMNKPLMLDIVMNHAIERDSLDSYLEDGCYTNPNNRCAILTPLTFDVDVQKQIKAILGKIVQLNDSPRDNEQVFNAEKSRIAEEIMAFSNTLSGHQQSIVNMALENLLAMDVNVNQDLRLLKNELQQVADNVARYEKEEETRAANEKFVIEQFDIYISSLEKINDMKVKLDTDLKLDHSARFSLVQELIEELALFIKRTSDILIEGEEEIEEVCGKQQQLLAHFQAVKLYMLQQQKIDALNTELTKLDMSERERAVSEYPDLDLSEEEILIYYQQQRALKYGVSSNEEALIIEHEQLAAQKAQLINELGFLFEMAPTSTLVEEEKRVYESLYNKLLLSFDSQEMESMKEKEPSTEKEKEKEKEKEPQQKKNSKTIARIMATGPSQRLLRTQGLWRRGYYVDNTIIQSAFATDTNTDTGEKEVNLSKTL
jgi:hypothetical protein